MNTKIIVVAIALFFSLPVLANKSFTIYGQLEKGRNDTLRFFAWPYLISTQKELQLPHTLQMVILKDGRFSVHLDGMESVFYFKFDLHKKGPVKKSTYFIAEPKDSVRVDFIDNAYRFSGTGAARYQCQQNTMEEFEKLLKIYAVFAAMDSAHYTDVAQRTVNNRMKMLHEQLQGLSGWKDSLPKDLYTTLRNNIIGETGSSFYSDYSYFLTTRLDASFSSIEGKREAGKSISAFFDRALKDTLFSKPLPHSNIMAKDYIQFIGTRDTFHKPAYTQEQCAEIIASLPENIWRDEEQTQFFVRNFEKFNDAEKTIRGALKHMSNFYCKELLASIVGKMSGKPDEDFVLTDTRDNKIKMSSFLNKVVVVDFWFTGCSGCTAFYDQTLKSLEERFADSSRFAFVSVCIDEDPVTWKKSIRENIYTSEKAINLKTSGKMHYDRILKYYNVLRYPTAIIIDKQGRTRTITSEHHNAEKLGQLLEKLVAE